MPCLLVDWQYSETLNEREFKFMCALSMTVAELLADVDEKLGELQAEIEAYDERAAIWQAGIDAQINGRTTVNLAVAALQRLERFPGEHDVARAWLREYAPHVGVFMKVRA